MNTLPDRCNDCRTYRVELPELGSQCAHPVRKYRVYLNPEERATRRPSDCPLLPKQAEFCGECEAVAALDGRQKYCKEMGDYPVMLTRSEIEFRRPSFCPKTAYQRSVTRQNKSPAVETGPKRKSQSVR